MIAGRLASVDALTSGGALTTYPCTWSVQGDLLEKPGRLDEARVAFARAAGRPKKERERARPLSRAEACTTT